MNQFKPNSTMQVATLKGLSSILIWSSIVAVIKLVTEALTPISGIALIYSFSAACILMFNGIPDFRKMSKTYLYGCGALFVSYEILFLSSIILSQSHEQVMMIAMMNYLWPPITVLMSIIAKQLNFNYFVILGFLISIFGLMLVVNPDILNLHHFWRILLENPVAYSFAFVGALLWSGYNVFTKKYGNGQNAVSLFFLTTLICLWMLHFFSGEAFIMPSLGLWAALAVMGSIIGISYYNWDISLQQGNIKLLILATYFIPILSSVCSTFILGVQPEFSFWIGTILVTLGALICWKTTTERI